MRVATLCLLASFMGTGAATAADSAPRTHCFEADDFLNWRAPDSRTVYIRADTNRIYRVDLARECPALRFPDSKLIFRIRGGNLVCSALDLDLRASEGFGDIPEPCFAKTMTELSPAEANSLSPKAKP